MHAMCDAARHGQTWPFRRWLSGLIWAASVLGTPWAHAQAGAACKPDGLAPEVLACATLEAQRSDTELQLRYSQQMQQASSQERPQLRKAHSAWLRERDRLCRQHAETQTGTDWALHWQRCLRQENQRRQASMPLAAPISPPAPKPLATASPP